MYDFKNADFIVLLFDLEGIKKKCTNILSSAQIWLSSDFLCKQIKKKVFFFFSSESYIIVCCQQYYLIYNLI